MQRRNSSYAPPDGSGFHYLVVVTDWYSWYVLVWRPSNTLDTSFCLRRADDALMKGRSAIFNSTADVVCAGWVVQPKEAGDLAALQTASVQRRDL
jgi:putative transposase